VTDLNTYLPEWFRFPFRVSLPRWHWRLEEFDDGTCLVAEARRPDPFVGDPELLDRLIELANGDDQAVERFANRYTGLYATFSGRPRAERVDAIRSEAVALSLLRGLGQVGALGSRAQARGIGASRLKEIDLVRRQAAAGLRNAASELRPLDVGLAGPDRRPERPTPSPHDVESGEWQILEWVAMTVEESWSLRVPTEAWLDQPMNQRDWTLSLPMPEVRCLTLLGYAYAQFIAQLQARSAITGSGRRTTCQRCGALLPDRGPSGHRRRSDAVWCANCRREKNAECQDVRRSRQRVERAVAASRKLSP
jgi:hypothetical protein